VKKGLFRRFCEEARAHPKRRYVLILDEINRGELPRILGELLYLLEYRQESVVLPYSGEHFAIPENLYLIGTMNTADRSIALVDHALRRRFHFVALRASPDVLRAYYESRGDAETAWVADLLEEANRQLEQDGIEWHLHIGHSHFMRPDLDEARLLLTWKHSILPTLEEYLYRQPERLQAYQLDTLKQALGRV
jgi:5-methylcytosine-specific restriction endonuclease McrBC GTP-binding regulatory subunit McrB